MSQNCRVEGTAAAERELGKIVKKDPHWFVVITDAFKTIEENGWVLSTNSQLIKVLDQKRHVGEIKLAGKGGYRVFFFWHDEQSTRVLYLTAMPQKKDVISTQRLNTYVDAAAERRRLFLENLKPKKSR